MVYIEKIRIRNFRSILDQTINSGNLNILVGNNDTGKSNVLKALNLFFNGCTEGGKNFDFSTDYCVFAKPGKNMAKEIVLEITFQPPKTFKESKQGLSIIWKKVWRKEGYHEKKSTIKYSDGSEISPHSRVETWLKRIVYRYVPAVKGSSYFSDLLMDLHEVLAATIEDELKTASKKFIGTIRKHTQSLKDNLKSNLEITSDIQLPPDLTDLFSTLDFETNVGDQLVSLKQRGDGIKARHIPIILLFLAEKEKAHHAKGAVRSDTIWGYEEPENNIELLEAFKVAEQFLNHADRIQIYLTTHSPAFYSLADSHDEPNIRTYFVKKSEDENETTLQMVDAKGRDLIDKSMGLLPLITPYIEEHKNKVLSLKKEVDDLKVEMESLNQPTLFVEGKTDKKILSKAIELLNPSLAAKFRIETKSSAGYNYVKNSLIAWAHLEKEVKAMGLFDKDKAGIEAKEIVDKDKKCENWKKKGYLRTQLLEASGDLRTVLRKLKVPFAIEDLFPPYILNHAQSQGWTEEKPDLIMMNDYRRTDISLKDDVQQRGLNQDMLIFFNKIKTEHKQDFSNYVCGLPRAQIKQAFSGIEPTLKKLEEYFS